MHAQIEDADQFPVRSHRIRSRRGLARSSWAGTIIPGKDHPVPWPSQYHLFSDLGVRNGFPGSFEQQEAAEFCAARGGQRRRRGRFRGACLGR